MKRFITAFCLLVLSLGVYAQEYNLDVEDDLRAFIKKNPPKYEIASQNQIGIPEGTLTMKGYKQNVGPEDTKIIYANGQPIAVTQHNKYGQFFLIDQDGNGKLNLAMWGYAIPPMWVVTESKYLKKSSKNNVDKYLDEIYKVFNGNENPYQKNVLNNKITELLELSKNKSIQNRDILYGTFLYYAYQKYNNHNMNYINMQMVLREYLERFNTKMAHPLIYLWMFEESLHVSGEESATALIPSLLELDSDFIPFQVYSWQYEKEPKLKEQKYKELKKKYPNHWIVKQI